MVLRDQGSRPSRSGFRGAGLEVGILDFRA